MAEIGQFWDASPCENPDRNIVVYNFITGSTSGVTAGTVVSALGGKGETICVTLSGLSEKPETPYTVNGIYDDCLTCYKQSILGSTVMFVRCDESSSENDIFIPSDKLTFVPNSKLIYKIKFLSSGGESVVSCYYYNGTTDNEPMDYTIANYRVYESDCNACVVPFSCEFNDKYLKANTTYNLNDIISKYGDYEEPISYTLDGNYNIGGPKINGSNLSTGIFELEKLSIKATDSFGAVATLGTPVVRLLKFGDYVDEINNPDVLNKYDESKTLVRNILDNKIPKGGK